VIREGWTKVERVAKERFGWELGRLGENEGRERKKRKGICSGGGRGGLKMGLEKALDLHRTYTCIISFPI